jgi:hypothetical protein
MDEELEDNTTADEVALHFKRFPLEKQDQVRALVNYATLMGLDGKDLVSIGGKLDRIRAKQVIYSNRAVIYAMEISTIGKDSNCWERWSYRGADGILYYFTNAGYYDVCIQNTKTKKKADCNIVENFNFGPRWRRNRTHNDYLANVMLNVHYGYIKLP